MGTSLRRGGLEVGLVGWAGRGDRAAPEPAGEGRVASEHGSDCHGRFRADRTWGDGRSAPVPGEGTLSFPWAQPESAPQELGCGRQPQGSERHRCWSLSPSAPLSLLVPIPPVAWGAGGPSGASSPLCSEAPGLAQWKRARAAEPSRTVIVPSSNVQGQLSLKPPARDRSPSFSQREAVSSRKNRVSVAGPLAPSASAWPSWGGRRGRAAQSQAPRRRGPRLGSAPACVWLGAGSVWPRLERGLCGLLSRGVGCCGESRPAEPAAPCPTRAGPFLHPCSGLGGVPRLRAHGTSVDT